MEQKMTGCSTGMFGSLARIARGVTPCPWNNVVFLNDFFRWGCVLRSKHGALDKACFTKLYEYYSFYCISRKGTAGIARNFQVIERDDDRRTD